MVNETGVDTSAMKYNVTDPGTIQGLFQHSNEFMGGGFAYGSIMVVWAIVFFGLNSYPNKDALVASTWVAFLTSAYLALIEIIEPAFSILLLVAALGLSALNQSTTR